MPTEPRQPSEETTQNGAADIVAAYHRVLVDDAEVTMPVAAIEALISVLGLTTSSTVMETLDIIRTEADRLRAAVPNSLPLTAGIDLFQQYLLRSLKKQDGSSKTAARPSSSSTAPATPDLSGNSSFEVTRQYLIRNSRLFAARAKEARATIADRGARLITEGRVVLTGGGSRAVASVLLRAADLHCAEHGSPRFRVVYVVDPRFSAKGDSGDAASVVGGLRARGVPVAEVDERAVAHVLRTAHVDLALLGAEVLCQNGGVFSRLGTFQLASLVRAFNQPVYIAAESHKIARVYPLGQLDLPRCGVEQELLFFRTAADVDHEKDRDAQQDAKKKPVNPDPVDYTPPDMITGVITEYGTKIPSGIYEMLLDIYS